MEVTSRPFMSLSLLGQTNQQTTNMRVLREVSYTSFQSQHDREDPCMITMLRLGRKNRVFITYYVFSDDFNIFRTRAFLCFPSVSVCVHTHTRQVENQRCSRTGRVQKNHNILRIKHVMNTL